MAGLVRIAEIDEERIRIGAAKMLGRDPRALGVRLEPPELVPVEYVLHVDPVRDHGAVVVLGHER